MVSKCNRIGSLVIFNNKNFVGEIPQIPLTRGGRTPSRALPHSCLRHSVNVDGVQWPYHSQKATALHQRSKNADGLHVTYIAFVDTRSKGLSVLYFKESEFQIKCISVPCGSLFFILANLADPDQMQHYTTYHLGLHCLPKYWSSE